ncbi:MAG: ABC transporter ATP-binding protein [Candidatus Zapsychrus exili]|nr:ABC transporter ATP-binding protein [Candidatus Zapsychrus exili]
MENYIRLLKFLHGKKKIFALAAFTMFISSFFEVFQLSLLVPMTDRIFNDNKIVVPNELPQFLSIIVDKLNAIQPKELFSLFLVVFIVALLLKSFLTFIYQYLMSEVSQRIMRDIRVSLYDKIQSLSLDYFSKKRTGELVSRITFDVNVVENAVSYGITDLCRQSFIIIMWMSTAFIIDPKASFVIFIIFPLIALPMAKIGSKLKKISKGTQEKMADINSLLLETISGVKLVKASCTEDYETKRFKDQNNAYYKLKVQSIKRLIVISPVTDIIGGFLGVGMLLWFGNRLFEGQLSFGVFILFFGAVLSLISPIKKLGNVNALTQQALAANKRIYDIFDAEITVKEKSDSIVLPELKDSIKLDNVSFHYYHESGLVLENINLEIKKGELVAIVGPTGVGKTTLVNLIPRFYDACDGAVTFDGVNVKDATFSSLRNQIGVVTQESILFNDTVKSNISYGKIGVEQQVIENAAKNAFAHNFIAGMPQGYDTLIGDRGFRLSGGEKQRLSIARAILRNAPILILDEATSQLDSESEKYVQEALDELMRGRTVIAIAHRFSTIKKADKIVVLEGGKVVGIGKHHELLESCELYKRLHSMQFQA